MATSRVDEGKVTEQGHASPSDVQFFAGQGFTYSCGSSSTWESFALVFREENKVRYVYHSGEGWRWTPDTPTRKAGQRFHTPIEAWIDAEGHAWIW